ncbi:MAG: lysylphosphatidylglycerol synthase transmembrane domain-containing protein [Chloroflexota bacterium]
MTRKQRLLVILGLAISVIFLAIAFNGLNPAAVWEQVRQANVPLLLLAVFWYFTSVTVISLRWQSLLRATKFVSLGKLFRLVCITYMGNNVYPLRTGEVLRVVLLQRDEKVPLASGGIVALTERVFDGIVMLTFVIVSLALLNVASADLRRVAAISAPIFILALLVFFTLALQPNLLRRLIARVSRILPGKLGEIVLRLGEDVIAGLEGLRSPVDLAKTVFYSYACWMLEASTYWIVSLAFNLHVDYTAMLLVVGVVNLAGLIPASPGQVGVYEYFAVLALGALGIEKTQATAFTLAIHLIIWLPVTLLGFYFLVRRGLGIGAVTHVEQLEKEAAAS